MLAVVRASITNLQSPCGACYSARLFFVEILHCDYAGGGFMLSGSTTASAAALSAVLVRFLRFHCSLANAT